MSQVLYSIELDGEAGKAQAHDWTPICVHDIDGIEYVNWMPRADFIKGEVDAGKTVKICNLTFLGIKQKHEEGETPPPVLMTITPTTGMPTVAQP